jgi:4-amino-4-deoxy-L-arabinose transferase-like glycosyltransferase
MTHQPTVAAPTEGIGRRHGAVLGLILAVAAGLRIHRLDYQSLRNDELSSWLRSSFPSFADVIEHGVLPDVHPPGYHLILYLVQRTIGDGEWALRAPSVVFGTLAVLAVFTLARRLYSTQAGLFAATLMATLWAPIRHSQEARPYSLLILLVTLTMGASYALIEAVYRNRPLALRHRVALVAWSTACCYTHYFGVLAVFVQALAALSVVVRSRRGGGVFAVSYGIVGLLYLPWLPGLLGQLGRGGSWIPPVDSGEVNRVVLYFLNNSTVMVAAAIIIMAAAVVVIRSKRRRIEAPPPSPDRIADRFAAWLLVSPQVTALLLSVTVAPMISRRNLLICLPPFIVLLARSTAVLRPPRWLPTVIIAALTIGSLGWIFGVLRYYTEPTTTQFREAVHHVIVRGREIGDVPVVACAWNRAYLDYYFREFSSARQVDALVCQPEDIERLLRSGSVDGGGVFWFVSAHRVPDPGVLEALRDRTVLLESRRFIGAYALLLELRQEPGQPESP